MLTVYDFNGRELWRFDRGNIKEFSGRVLYTYTDSGKFKEWAGREMGSFSVTDKTVKDYYGRVIARRERDDVKDYVGRIVYSFRGDRFCEFSGREIFHFRGDYTELELMAFLAFRFLI